MTATEKTIEETVLDWLPSDLRPHVTRVVINKISDFSWRVNCYTERTREGSTLKQNLIEASYFVSVDLDGNITDKTA